MNNRQNIVQRILLVFVFFVAASISVHAEVTDCTMVISDEAKAVSFLTKTKEGQKVEVNGVLMKPDGKGPFPGMVILHGHGGVYPPRCYGGVLRIFAELGYVSLLIDSDSTPRPSRWQGKYTSDDQAQDAHKGKDFLARLPYVIPEKIGVIGWSMGGTAVMEAISNNRLTFILEKNAPFQAAVTIYPICYKKINELETPLQIFIGEADVKASAVACRNMIVKRKGDVEYQLIVYPGVAHVYDAQWLSYYDEAASEDTYDRLQKFFAKYLQR